MSQLLHRRGHFRGWRPPGSPLLWFPMTDNVVPNGTVLDASGNGFNGTLVSGAYVKNGCFWAQDGAGGSDGIVVPYNTAFNLSEGTMSCWFNVHVEAGDYVYVFSKGGEGGGYSIMYLPPSRDPSAWMNTTSGNQISNAGLGYLTLNNWYHIAITWKVGASYSPPYGREIWVNGVRRDYAAIQASIINSGWSLYIGYGGNGRRSFYGMITQAVLYSSQLSAANIALLAAMPPPTAAWPPPAP